MAALIERLPHCISRQQIDNLAIEFCLQATKANRKRLVKVTLPSFSTHVGRSEASSVKSRGPFPSRLPLVVAHCVCTRTARALAEVTELCLLWE